MSAIETWLRQPAAQAMGWALFQFIWQGAGVAILSALALLALRRSAADVRYVVSAIGLALMLTLPIVTGVQKYQALQADAGALVAAVDVPSTSDFAGLKPRVSRLKPGAPGETLSMDSTAGSAVWSPSGWLDAMQAEALLPALMLVWLAGVTLLTLRLLTGWLWVQRLRTHGTASADEACRRMASRLIRRLRITRAVTLLESSLVDVPTVIGFLRPVVLLPASALAGLTPQQIEAILAHELAHIRRHDYLVNLLQTLVETVLFYHPAVWWLSRRIRIERENCCDDLAVSLCGDPVAYATALADLEALRSSGPVPERHIAMAATGGSLLHRIRRLLGAPSSHSGRGPAWLAGTVALLLVGGIALGAADAQRTPAARAAAPQNVTVAPSLRAPVVLQPTVLPALAKASARVPIVGSLPASIAGALLAPLPGLLPIAAPQPPEAPPATPAPPAAAAPVASSQSISHQANDSSGNWNWSNNGESLEVSYRGRFEFTDDDTDLRQMSAGGSLKISDGKWLGRHSVEIRERDGQLEHAYYVNGSLRPYEPEGRVWLRQNLPRFVRNTGIGADGRVARGLKGGGPAAVLTEIGRVDSVYVKGIYFRELFKQASLSADQYRQAMAQASREMRSSSYELAQLLIAVAERLPNDEGSRAAYFQAGSAISSSYELRRVYSTMLKRGPVPAAVLAGILQSARSITSDYELSELLRQIASGQEIDGQNRAAFFALAAGMHSDYERHRVLNAAVAGRYPVSGETLRSALEAARFSSDYEASVFLQEVVKRAAVDASTSAAFFQVVHGIGSNYEKGRVLQAVVRRGGAGDDTLRAVLQSSRTMDGYELSQLLQAIAASYTLSGDLREAYLAAADRLGNYDQTQVMAALVKSERRR